MECVEPVARMMSPTRDKWQAKFEQQLAYPALNLVGLLQSRRLKWLGQILCQSSDRLFRQELLRLALAKREGVQSTEATLLELVLGGDVAYQDPQDLIRLVRVLTTRRTLKELTPTQRAEAELRQRDWAAEVYSLRGLGYDPKTADQVDRETLDSDEEELDLRPCSSWQETSRSHCKNQGSQRHRAKSFSRYGCTPCVGEIQPWLRRCTTLRLSWWCLALVLSLNRALELTSTPHSPGLALAAR